MLRAAPPHLRARASWGATTRHEAPRRQERQEDREVTIARRAGAVRRTRRNGRTAGGRTGRHTGGPYGPASYGQGVQAWRAWARWSVAAGRDIGTLLLGVADVPPHEDAPQKGGLCGFLVLR